MNMIRIIIVEDEKPIRIGMVSMIESMGSGLSVLGSFGNGLEAVQFLTKQAVDVIITDISMPKMDGFELAVHVRQNYPSINIVILSGFNQFDYVRNALRSGVSDYLVKPVNKKELYHILRKLQEKQDIEKQRESQTTDLLLKSYLTGDMNAEQLAHLWEPFITYKRRDIPCRFIVYQANLTATTAWISDFSMNMRYQEMRNCRITANLQLMIVIGGEDSGDMPSRMVLLPQTKSLEEMPFVGISSEITSIEEWPRGFSEAISAYCMHWHVAETPCVFTYVEPSYHRSEISGMVAQIDALLQNTTKWMDRAELQKIKGHIYRQAKRIQIRWADLCRVLGYLLYQLRMRISPTNNQMLLSLSDSNELELQVCEHATLHDVLEDIFGKMDGMLADLELSSGAYERKIVSIVKKCVDNGYNRELELSEIANQVHLTPNYVSFLFRKETGMTITEYVMDYRITKAKELLLTQLELKTYEVGQAVGYPDAAYFNRIFKKIVGITPRMYREQTQISQTPY
jgi:two-component system response regulator YesN